MSGEWPSGRYVTSAKHVGGGGGGPFQSIKQLGDGIYAPVSKIEVFAEDWKITGIKLAFSDGSAGQMHGTRGKYREQFDFQAGELVTNATIWPTENKDRLSQIYFRTNQNREWYGTAHAWRNIHKQTVDVGNGVFLGIGGRCGGDIDRAGLVFLSDQWPIDDKFARRQYAGGGGGSSFQSTKQLANGIYALVSKIEVFAEDWKITGIKLTFVDGTAGKVHGTRGQYSSHFDFQAGELVTKATVWSTERKDRLAQIFIKTNRNREWYGTPKNWWPQFPQDAEVGNGLLVGVGGRCGSHIDCMGLIFLSGQWPNGDNFTSPKFAGGGGGSPFDGTKWSENKGYAPVSKIEVFSKDWTVTGVRLSFANGTTGQMYGTQDKYYSHFSFQADELVTKATIWSSEHNKRLSQVYIKTNKNREWYGAEHNWWSKSPQDVEIGSGLFVGVGGRCGSEIDRMGLVFLRSTFKNITIDDFRFKDVNAWERPATLGGLSPQVLSRTTYSNKGPSPVIDWNFGDSFTRTATTTFRQNSATTYGALVEVEVFGRALCIGAKATAAGFEWQKTEERTRSHSESQDVTISSGHITGQLKLGESVVCQMVISGGHVALNYNARVRLTFADDNLEITYREDGTLIQSCWSPVEVTATPMSLLPVVNEPPPPPT